MSQKTVQAKYCEWAIDIADDNSHGYSQAVRWSPDYDCSSFVISALEAAGLPMRAYGASYTGNMPDALAACGFVNVFPSVNIQTGEGLRYGDILLNPVTHTEIYLFDKLMVGAHCSETGGKYGEEGDQTGNEISVCQYRNKNFTQVWRYEKPVTMKDDLEKWKDVALEVIRGKYGNGEDRVRALLFAGYSKADINEIQQTVNYLIKEGKVK